MNLDPRSLFELAFYSSFLLAIASVLLAKWRVPLLLKYGKTLQGVPPETGILGSLQRLTVPKKWFGHFYVYSTALALLNVCTLRSFTSLLVLAHSARRLYETRCVSKFGKDSRIHISHYLVGIWFYTVANYAVFVDRTRAYSPLARLVAVIMFVLSSFDQHQNHLHLSKLVKYTLPTYGLFQLISSPHYFDEILIYSSLAIYTSSFKMFLCLMWVIINLSTSALETKGWYAKKFPQSAPPFAIIPYLL
ncbi:LAQU0S09e00936g1_1 [Lachancea quebecensis]|uniref:Polyprenal reductase n=1 Tax=Lachancea quebecensis TaxID=1654605 RepID=A0A0N7MLU5_9SACH|nr:LAQU0S09e00936g1_1 [Lachancea quebecensis]